MRNRTAPHIPILLAVTLLLGVASACQSTSDGKAENNKTATTGDKPTAEPGSTPSSAPAEGDREGFPNVDLAPAGKGIATFAGGCFWCMEPPFEAMEGVEAVYSGYAGGKEANPTYHDVGYGKTGHTEAVRVIYDKDKVSYELLAKVFWRNINPTQVNGQFPDHGTQYRTAIFYHDADQKRIAEETRKEVAAKFDDPIVTEITEITAANAFYPAETYHQDFYLKDKDHYSRYRNGSGRDAFLKKVWGDEAGGYSLHGGEKKH